MGALFLVLYFLSGAAALLYEVVWLRLLTLSMGHSTRAVGILLAAFMGGLAIGAWAAGRTSAALPRSRALRTYAVLEASIAACALLLPLLLSSLVPVLQWVYLDGNGGMFDATIALLALLLLSAPTAAMGATYPVAVRCAAGEAGRSERPEGVASPVARFAGGLYAANTFGAALGAGLTGFVLLPALGIRGTTIVGVALNAAAAIGALLLARQQAAEEPGEVAPARASAAAGVSHVRAAAFELAPRVRLRAAATALGVSGLVALIYQVTWTRTLAMVLGPTTYAFSAMVVAVIAGLGIGSTVAAVRAPRSPARSKTWLGCVLIAAAAAALVASLTVDRLPLVVASLVIRPGVTFESVLAMQVGLAVAIQLPMAIAFGAAFPLAIAAADSKTGTAPQDVSFIYAVNTLGAIVGAIAASFLLIPAFGIQMSVRLAAILAAVTGVAVAVDFARPTSVGPRVRIAATLAGVATAALALVAPEWNQSRLANGGYRYATMLAAGDLEAGLEAGRLLYYREGAAGTVSVREIPGARSLAIDGKVDASNTGDMLTQKLLAHLPLLLHPNPRRICIIGLGSGVTLGASLVHPIERADIVEISPEVVEASAFFVRENHDALNDPRTRLIVGDGRSHLLLSTEQYDVIISEPSNPWMAGVASLFTREFFLAARARLAAGGIFLQWAHTYNISDADLRSIVATFISVFPEGSAWLVGNSDLLLAGATAPIGALDHGLSASWARTGVAADLAEVAVRDPFSVLSLFVGGAEGLQQYGAGANIQSDDRMLLEYSAPRALYGSFQRANVDQLRAISRNAREPPAVALARSAATAEQWRNRGLMQLRTEAADLAYADLREAVMRGLTDTDTLHGLARAAFRLNRLDDTQRLLNAIAYAGAWRQPGASDAAAVPALIELSIVRAALGRADEATAAARDAVLRDPANRAALKQLASMYADNGDEDALERLIQLVQQTKDRAVLLYCQTRLAYVRGEFDAAIELGEQLVMLEPSDVNVHNLLGSAYATLGRYDLSRNALEASLRIEPANPGVLVNLGTIALRAGDASTAVDRFSEALFLSPLNADAMNGLADALERQGNQTRAAEIRELVPSQGTP